MHELPKSLNIKSLQEKMAYTFSSPLDTDKFELTTENYPPEFLNQIEPLKDITSVYQAGTYNQQYWFRLINCMQDQFPLLLYLMGLAKFNRLSIEFLTAYPSENPNLNILGRQLSLYIDNLKKEEVKSKIDYSHKSSIKPPVANLKILKECAEMEAVYNELFIKEEKIGLKFADLVPHLKDLGKKKFFFREDVFFFHHQYLLQPHLLPVRQKSFFSSSSKPAIQKQENFFFMFSKGRQVHCVSATSIEIALFSALKSGQPLNKAMTSLLQEKKVVHPESSLEEFMGKIGMFEWLEKIG